MLNAAAAVKPPARNSWPECRFTHAEHQRLSVMVMNKVTVTLLFTLASLSAAQTAAPSPVQFSRPLAKVGR